MLLRLEKLLAALGLLVLTAPFLLSLTNQTVEAGPPCTADPRNMTVNGSLGDGYNTSYGVVGNYWNPFIFAGDPPHFDLVSNENAIGDSVGQYSQYISSDRKTFDAGIYQVVSGTRPGVYYQFSIGFALAARDFGNGVNVRVDSIGRQAGFDPLGGTDPHAPSVVWGPVFWAGGPALSISELSGVVAAQANQVTVFARAMNRDTGARDKVWFDLLCMFERSDLPTATPVAPTATNTPPPTNTRAATNTPRPTEVPTDTPTSTPTLTSTPSPTPTETPTETPAPRRAFPTVDSVELRTSAVSLDATEVLGGIGVIALGAAGVMMLAGALVWLLRR